MATDDQKTIYQYSDGRDLLSATLVERERLLRELEDLVKGPFQDGHSEINNRFDLVKAQTLLYERLMIGEKIDSLVVLLNHFAKKAGQLGLEIVEVQPR